jgi:acetyl esterase
MDHRPSVVVRSAFSSIAALAWAGALAACSGGGGGAPGGSAPSAGPTVAASAIPTPTAAGTPLATPTAVSHPSATPTPAPAATTYPVSETGNVSYGPSPDEILDAYVPADGKTTRPAVMVVHGGGSTSGDKSNLSTESLAIAAAGFTVFNLNYTLSTPTVPGYPVQGDQVQAAIVWARANAATYGVDPARIGGLGSSHGAELIDLVALEGSGSQQTGDRLMAAVSWSGPTDLVSLYAIECPAGGPSCLGKAEIEYLDCLYPACPAQYVAASPVTYVDSSDPPIAIYNSTNELVPLPQANELASDLAAASVPYQLTIYPGSLHAQEYHDQALAPSIQFLQTELYR